MGIRAGAALAAGLALAVLAGGFACCPATANAAASVWGGSVTTTTTDNGTTQTGTGQLNESTGTYNASGAQPYPASFQPSGPAWARKFPASSKLADLSNPFRGDVTRFIAAMTRAGIHAHAFSTLRPSERAYLMHYAWMIGDKKIDPRDVPAFVPKRGQSGVGICWVHAKAPGVPDLPASVRAAEQMLPAFGIDPRNKVPPALDSVHTRGQAIDMTTTWTSAHVTIVDAHGHRVTIDTLPRDGVNAQLISVGATYGVIHLRPAGNDPNHWSVNGR